MLMWVGQYLYARAYLCATSSLHWFILFVIQGHTDMQSVHLRVRPKTDIKKLLEYFKVIINWYGIFFNLSGERTTEEKLWSEADISSSEGTVFPWTLIWDLHKVHPFAYRLLCLLLCLLLQLSLISWVLLGFTLGKSSLTLLQGYSSACQKGDLAHGKGTSLCSLSVHMYCSWRCRGT